MGELKYRIGYDFLTREKRIEWNKYLIYREGTSSTQGWEIHLDFNIKNNKPYLHFRYYGITRRLNDRVHIGSSFSNIELKVVNKPHRYNSKLKEVDFLLFDTDIDFLLNYTSHDIFIVFSNGDSAFMPKYAAITSHSYGGSVDVDNILISKRRNEEICSFKHYLELYSQALKDAKVNIDKEDLPERVREVSKASGLSPSILKNILQVNSNQQPKVERDFCYVYLMKDKRNGYHKIGISKEPKYREKTLQSEQPAIEMVCNKRYPSRKIAEAIEAALHKAYAEQRVRGEWFNLSDIDVQMLIETLS